MARNADLTRQSETTHQISKLNKTRQTGHAQNAAWNELGGLEINMKTCKKIEALVDVRLVAEPPYHLFQYRHNLTIEKREKILKDWVSEFQEFIRDHRSADPVGLSVERVIEEVCSACGGKWEQYQDENGRDCCACCGVAIETSIEAEA